MFKAKDELKMLKESPHEELCCNVNSGYIILSASNAHIGSMYAVKTIKNAEIREEKNALRIYLWTFILQ